MGTILCIVDKAKTREHAEDLNGKGSRCEPKFPGWVGWERRQKFKVTMNAGDSKGKALLASKNVMVLMQGPRYDIQFEDAWNIKRVDKITFREMFRLKPNGESDLDDVHWKCRSKNDVCAIWTIATLELTLWAARWTEQGHEGSAANEQRKYGQSSAANEAPITCNDNDPRGAVEGTQDDPLFSEVVKRQIPGYSGDASYSYCPWHCPIVGLTIEDLLDWLRFVDAEVRRQLGDDTFSLWRIMEAWSRKDGDSLPEDMVSGPKILAPAPTHSVAQTRVLSPIPPVAMALVSSAGLIGGGRVLRGMESGAAESTLVAASVVSACPCGSTGCSCIEVESGASRDHGPRGDG